MPPFAAETRSATTTLVTFDGGDLGGALAVADWSIMESGGVGTRLVALVVETVTTDPADSVRSNTVGTPHGAAVASVTVGASPAVTQILITHPELSSTASTPTVSYRGTGLTEGGEPVPRGDAVAADGAPPTFEAELASASTVRIIFSERVDGTTAQGEWAVAGSVVSSVEPSAPSSATEVVLALASARAGTDLGGLDASGVTYTRPTVGTNTIQDDADNHLATNAGDTVTAGHVTDKIAPTATVTATVRLEGDDADHATVTTAGIGDDVRVNVVASEPLATAVGDIALFGTSIDADSVDTAAGNNMYSYVRTILDSDASDPLAFALTISDSEGNETTLTQADLTGTKRDSRL